MSDEIDGLKNVVVTTPLRGTFSQVQFANTVAELFKTRFFPRNERSIEDLFDVADVDTIVIADDPIKLFRAGMEMPFFFHPSMAAQRIQRIRRGERDRLLDVARIQPGDQVVDTTLGLASDALVFREAVRAHGCVIGIEVRDEIVHLLRAVQKLGSATYPEAAQGLQDIEIVHANHLDWLVAQPDDSVDLIYFDPMFRTPSEASSSVLPLRAFAYPETLTAMAIAHARRVTRRTIVVKENASSGLFDKFDLLPDVYRRKWAYGVWHKT